MFKDLFSKFKKTKVTPVKNESELIQEFEKLKKAYASIATSQLYQLIKEYFETKIEINRDALEATTLQDKIQTYQAEIRIMRSFIQDIEDMRSEYEREMAEKAEVKIEPEL